MHVCIYLFFLFDLRLFFFNLSFRTWDEPVLVHKESDIVFSFCVSPVYRSGSAGNRSKYEDEVNIASINYTYI